MPAACFWPRVGRQYEVVDEHRHHATT